VTERIALTLGPHGDAEETASAAFCWEWIRYEGDATALSSRPFTGSTVGPVPSTYGSAFPFATSAAAASTVTSDVVDEEEAADDAAVLLPPPARCREVLGGGSLDGDYLLQRNARIDEVFGQPFRQAHPAEGLLAAKSQKGAAMDARRALLHRQAGLGPCTSYLQFGMALNQKGKANMVLWPVAAACLSHVPAFSTLPKVRAAFQSYFPGGMQATPEWSSASGKAALALLERELAARFVGGAFTTDTPVADVRQAHLPELVYWTSAQLRAQITKPAVAQRHPEMVACLSSGRTTKGQANRVVQRAGWHAAEQEAAKLARATQATARGVQKSLGSPPHWALALVALGTLHTPSDLAVLEAEGDRLRSASALGKLVLARRLDVTPISVGDFLGNHRKGTSFASVPLVTATSAGLDTVRRLLTLDESGWEELLDTILERLVAGSLGLSSSSSSSTAAAATTAAATTAVI